MMEALKAPVVEMVDAMTQPRQEAVIEQKLYVENQEEEGGCRRARATCSKRSGPTFRPTFQKRPCRIQIEKGPHW